MEAFRLCLCQNVQLTRHPVTHTHDAVSRRAVWKLITELKQDRIVILTTHSMEEGEYGYRMYHTNTSMEPKGYQWDRVPWLACMLPRGTGMLPCPPAFHLHQAASFHPNAHGLRTCLPPPPPPPPTAPPPLRA
jgi:hypothetical protein